jgi:HEAT repeat protein
VRRFANDPNYVVRQITMNCVEAIGDATGGDILASGLADGNVNVRLAAARALATRSYPSAASSIVAALQLSDDETFRELLVTAAGYSPEGRTISVLTPLSAGDSVLAHNAVLALAKLGSETGRKMLSAKLSAKLPRTRYEALEGLCYVNDKRFSAEAKRLLSDKAVGLRIGSVRSPKYRRVADQAVDSLVCLLGLRVSFTVSSERIYSDQEIASILAVDAGGVRVGLSLSRAAVQLWRLFHPGLAGVCDEADL